MYIGYKIDVTLKTVEPITINSWKDIAPALNCDLFDLVNISETDGIFVDDEGFLKPQVGYFVFEGYPGVLAGHGIVSGTDEAGESIAPTLTIEQVRAKIIFMNHLEAMAYAKKHNL